MSAHEDGYAYEDVRNRTKSKSWEGQVDGDHFSACGYRCRWPMMLERFSTLAKSLLPTMERRIRDETFKAGLIYR